MYLIIGLGNPGEKYADTYHNLGFMCADALAARLDARFTKNECRALTAHARIGREKVVIAKPFTFMNLSGESAAELVNKYKTEKEKFLVIYDDFELPAGSIRIRYTGSAGTHNGMKSVVARCGTEDIYRIRIGAGPLPEHYDIVDFVLSSISAERKAILAPAIDRAAEAAYAFAGGESIEKVMAEYNLKVK